MAGTLGVFFTAKFLGNAPFITYWGRYSLMILCTHILLLQVLVPIGRKCLSIIPLSVIAIIILIIVMFSYQLLIPIMKKYIPYFTAQKDVINISKYVR